MPEYFYDHQTDQLSITLGDFAEYRGSEEVAPGVIVHIDALRRALGVEIREAKAIVGLKGLQSFESGTMTAAELSQRMQDTVNGRVVLRAIQGG
jgi:hypothetical protein